MYKAIKKCQCIPFLLIKWTNDDYLSSSYDKDIIPYTYTIYRIPHLCMDDNAENQRLRIYFRTDERLTLKLLTFCLKQSKCRLFYSIRLRVQPRTMNSKHSRKIVWQNEKENRISCNRRWKSLLLWAPHNYDYNHCNCIKSSMVTSSVAETAWQMSK